MAKPASTATTVTPVATATPVQSDKAKLLATAAIPSQEEIDTQVAAFEAAKKQAFADACAALGLVAKPKAAKVSEPIDYRESGIKAAATYKASLEAARQAAFAAGKPLPLSAGQKAALTKLKKQAAWEAKQKEGK
jgi:hypothetical protein